jgi:hypothetical protein
MLREDKNQNGKRNPVTQITRKKARNVSKNKAKLEKLQEVLEKTSQKEGLQNWNLTGIAEQCKISLRHNEVILPLEASRPLERRSRMARNTVIARKIAIGPLRPRHNGWIEAFLSLEESVANIIYLIRRTSHRGHFCKLRLPEPTEN